MAEPNPVPVNLGINAGTVAPPEIETLGAIVTFEESLLTSVMKTPAGGAGALKVTG